MVFCTLFYDGFCASGDMSVMVLFGNYMLITWSYFCVGTLFSLKHLCCSAGQLKAELD
jgi:hypothetical protein